MTLQHAAGRLAARQGARGAFVNIDEEPTPALGEKLAHFEEWPGGIDVPVDAASDDRRTVAKLTPGYWNSARSAGIRAAPISPSTRLARQ